MGHWVGPKTVPIKSLVPRHDTIPNHKVPARYANKPIQIKDGAIYDGHHRRRDAIAAGKTHIKAYIWVDK